MKVFQEQLILSICLGSLQVTGPLDSETDAEEEGGRLSNCRMKSQVPPAGPCGEREV